MAFSSRAIVAAALCVGFTATSCAFQPNSSKPLAIEQDGVPPTVLTGNAEQEGKKLSAIGSDADCVLTTGDIHLWCKWIARYY